jgi:cystathionine beta-lyase/cystathionine gamma-synthase
MTTNSSASEFQDFKPMRLLEPVGGQDYGTTAEIPDLQTVIDYEENRCRLSCGYYRMVDRPSLYKWQADLQKKHGVSRAVAFVSGQSALRELIDFLLTILPNLRVAWKLPELVPSWLNELKAAESDSLEPRLWINPDLGVDQRSEWFDDNQHTESDQIIWYSAQSFAPLPIQHENEFWVGSIEKMSTPGGVVLGKSPELMEKLFQLRKRRGALLSVRNIGAWQNEEPVPNTSSEDSEKICLQLNEWEEADECFLFPSGMNAVVTAMELARRRCQSRHPKRFVAIGLLYTDTYSLLMFDKWRGGNGEPIFLNTDELDQLPKVLKDDSIAGIVTESITNPLGEVPDIPIIQDIAKKYKIPVIVDNTLAGPINAQPLTWGVDMVVHSTAKYLCGNNQHGGGVLLTRTGYWSERLRAFQLEWKNLMSPWEVLALRDCMKNFPERMERFNQNGVRVAHFLEEHPMVRSVCFNQLPSHPSYELAKKLLKGSSSLISFVLQNDNLDGIRRFYDADLRPLHKAPGLGSDTSMICPYAMLAHYQLSDRELKELRISRYLVRLAVGCEKNLDKVFKALDRGFRA